jgi:C4-dicarboxylate-specific signal transduction histidine kinase
MTHQRPSWRSATSSVLPIATASFAIGIFIGDTFTHLEIAVAVLYVVVVLMAARFWQTRGILLISLGCAGLTVLSFFLSPATGPAPATAIINMFISLAAIGLTSFLVLRSQSAEVALRQAHANLAHVNRVTTMGELTASLAHEVNQPITAALTDANSCLRWLTRDRPDVEEAREAALRIVKDATRAADIISRIRLLFKKSAPQQELVDVNEVIRGMIVLLHSEAARYSISVRTELAADLPEVTGDRVQLQQVLMNLMLNGIDAMKDMNAGRELTIKSEPENGQLLISVSDTGMGLPPKQADQIFNAFFTTKVHGTGMGLSISRSIAESHGGRLWAADKSPRGVTFYFTLPLRVEAH